MGKNLIQQARGKGSPTYRSPSHRYKGSVKHTSTKNPMGGEIVDLMHCPGHSSPLAFIRYDNGQECLMIASEGMRVGSFVVAGAKTDLDNGYTSMLKDIPEGTLIYNIERIPGDGGKFVRASGTFARVVSRVGKKVVVQLPSKKKAELDPKCRANIGVVASGGRTDKPFLKAGKKYHAMRARNKLYPLISGAAANAVDHPFGNKRSSRKSKSRPAPKNAPPGRKVGMIRPRRSGRKK